MDGEILATRKTQRKTAKGRFTRYSNLLTNLINENADILEIETLFEDVKSAWNTVNQKHDEYVNSLPEDTESNDDEWISEIENTFIDVRKKVINAKRSVESYTYLLTLQKTYAERESNYITQCKNVESLINNCCTPELLGKEKAIIYQLFEEFKRSHVHYDIVIRNTIVRQLGPSLLFF